VFQLCLSEKSFVVVCSVWSVFHVVCLPCCHYSFVVAFIFICGFSCRLSFVKSVVSSSVLDVVWLPRHTPPSPYYYYYYSSFSFSFLYLPHIYSIVNLFFFLFFINFFLSFFLYSLPTTFFHTYTLINRSLIYFTYSYNTYFLLNHYYCN